MATKKSVDLLHLVKTDDSTAKIGIAALVLVREKVIDTVAYSLEDSSLNGGNINFNPHSLAVVEDGERYSLDRLVKKRWNDGMNASVKLGENTVAILNPTVIGINGEETTMTKISIRLNVVEHYFEGPWVIEEAQGLYNVLNDSFHAYGNMKSARLSIKEMQNTFRPLLADEVDQSKYSIILDVTSQFTMNEED